MVFRQAYPSIYILSFLVSSLSLVIPATVGCGFGT